MYLHSSKAIVEEAEFLAGSFLFLTAHLASEFGGGTVPLSFDLNSFHVGFFLMLKHHNAGLLSD